MTTADQVTPCHVPLEYFEWAGLSRPVHAGIVADLTWIRHEWLLRGGQRWYPIRSWWGYARRDCKSGGHPRGVAVDINPAENPMVVTSRRPCPSDMPPEFIALFKQRGFGHGADWRSKCDAMHMSKLKYEGGDGRLYVPAGELVVVPSPPEVTTPEGDPEMKFVRKRGRLEVYTVPGLFLSHIDAPGDLSWLTDGRDVVQVKEANDPVWNRKVLTTDAEGKPEFVTVAEFEARLDAAQAAKAA